MEFKRDILRELVYGSTDGMEVVLNELVDTGRWSLHYRLVFKFEGKFYETAYSCAATECQDERPFEYDNEMIKCHEVVPTEVKRIDYVGV